MGQIKTKNVHSKVKETVKQAGVLHVADPDLISELYQEQLLEHRVGNSS